MGFVVLNGLFEPGTSVSLVRVADEAVITAGHGDVVGRRLVDADGLVGFDGLDGGDRFIAVGFDVYGNLLESRCRTLFSGDGTELAQPPARPVPQLVGTQEAVEMVEAPGVPGAILQSGVPVGAIDAALAA